MFRPDIPELMADADYQAALQGVRDQVAGAETAAAEAAAQKALDTYGPPADGKAVDTPAGKEVMVGAGCNGGSGDCTSFKFDASGNVVGQTTYHPDGSMSGWIGQPTAYDGAQTVPSQTPIGQTAYPPSHPWRGGSAPATSSPPAQPILDSSGAQVGSRQAVAASGVHSAPSTWSGTTAQAIVYRDAAGNVCSGSACGYDAGSVSGEGTAAVVSGGSGDGTGDGTGEDYGSFGGGPWPTFEASDFYTPRYGDPEALVDERLGQLMNTPAAAWLRGAFGVDLPPVEACPQFTVHVPFMGEMAIVPDCRVWDMLYGVTVILFSALAIGIIFRGF